jgi:hypothetical protein
MSRDVVVASSSEENRIIVVVDQGEHPVLCGSQSQFWETEEMNEKQSQISARNVGWECLEASVASFILNHHVKRGVHRNNIRKFSFCLAIKGLPQNGVLKWV